jgi:hypothetical protein
MNINRRGFIGSLLALLGIPTLSLASKNAQIKKGWSRLSDLIGSANDRKFHGHAPGTIILANVGVSAFTTGYGRHSYLFKFSFDRLPTNVTVSRSSDFGIENRIAILNEISALWEMKIDLPKPQEKLVFKLYYDANDWREIDWEKFYAMEGRRTLANG